MKAKLILIKVEDIYRLVKSTKYNNKIIATSDLDYQKTWSDRCQKLSKQNCDEIFGAVDVEKLFDEVDKTIDFHEFCFTSFKLGLNKAMELNKDKVFTIEDCKKLMKSASYGWFEKDFDKHIQSLQQPTEIEVEIVVETASLNPHDLICEEIVVRPKLDSEGCLILTKLINP